MSSDQKLEIQDYSQGFCRDKKKKRYLLQIYINTGISQPREFMVTTVN